MNEMDKVKYKEIIPCVYLDGTDITQDIIHLDNIGADGIFLIEDDFREQEEALIKCIKSICSKSDIPLYVKRHYRRLEDIKKILYAGAAHIVMSVVSAADFRLMEEAVGRFGSEKVFAWVPETQPLNNALVDEIKQKGAGACVVEHQDLSIFKLYHMPVIVKGKMAEAEELANILKEEIIRGVTSEKLALKDSDVMGVKSALKGYDIKTNCFESAIPFSEFKLDGDGLIPVVVQEYKTEKVLMVAYMNAEAFEETIRSGRMTYWSRSRQELWKKGETSGHYQYVRSLDIDCDRDTILAKVVQIGAACHTGNDSCFFTNLAAKSYDDTNPMTIFDKVMETIIERKNHPKEGSYTNYLFDKGIDKILKKVGEEATEIVIAAKNPDSDELKYEICDFLYHMMVLMVERDVTWKEITRELAERH